MGIRFGDNDRLGAMVRAHVFTTASLPSFLFPSVINASQHKCVFQVAGLVRADYLYLLTDVDALYTSNPKVNPDAERIAEVQDVNKLDEMLNGDLGAGSRFGTGGMQTKITAARLGAAQGVATVIMHVKDLALMKGVMDKSVDTGIYVSSHTQTHTPFLFHLSDSRAHLPADGSLRSS